MDERQQPSRLYRSNTDRAVAGFCSSVAEYINIDPIIVRVILLSAILFAGSGLLLYVYIVCWAIIENLNFVQQSQNG